MTIRRLVGVAAMLATGVSLVACGSGDSGEPSQEPGGTTKPGTDLPKGVFESAHPSGQLDPSRGSDPGLVGETATDGVTANPSGPVGAGPSAGAPSPVTPGQAENAPPAAPLPMDPSDDSANAAARAIEEADVIKRAGDRLYALSALGGLSVIDVSNPDALRLLGRHRTVATPFEMYVRDETVFVLYNGWGQYTYVESSGSYDYYQTSYVMALDASNPAQIEEDERFEIAGYIADSRLVGDVLYVAAFDDSYCYRCGDTPETNLLSLDVSDPEAIEKVDELTFEERLDDYSWRRSLSSTDQRLYVAGPRYGNGAEPEGSVIQVVDISDPGGDMVAGDSVQVKGQINSRWQMDEFDGTLRVISQPLWWAGGTPPTLETFQIESSETITPLASLDLVLPRPETLQAVRFDGSRGYAITFEQTDPLFTLDLSDPAAPVQAGELEMPGWVYYMEPRGDRVIGLGFDQGNPEGGLTVSIFDVSTLATPTMIDRVNFGGEWGSLAEDQDRIHKSFQVLDDRELILVPFSGYDWDESSNQCGGTQTYTSGVQLIDWVDDTLTLRGVAASSGQARRSFFVDDRLLTMSDQRLESFDISDMDTPKSTSKLDLAQIVNQITTVGDAVVHIGDSWWGQALEVNVSSLDELTSYQPGSTLVFDDMNRSDCTSDTWLSNIMSGGDNVYLLYTQSDWSSNEYKQQYRVRTIDASDPSEPRIAGDAELGFSPSYGRQYVPGMVDNGGPAVGVGNALVFAEHQVQYNDRGFIIQNDYALQIVDFSDADAPKKTSLKMPSSLGSTGLLTSGKVVATSHFETSPSNPNAVRFYLDRVDLSDPSEPELLPQVNIPGSLVAYDAKSERALTIDYQYVLLEDVSPKQCYEEEFGNFVTPDPSLVDYENARGQCSALRYTLHLLDVSGESAALVGSQAVDKGVQITAAAVGEDRVFLGTGAGGGYYYGPGDIAIGVPAPGPVAPGIGSVSYIPYYSYPVGVGEAKLLVVSGLAEGDLNVASTTLETTSSFYGFSGLIAKGTTAVVATGWQGRLSVVDASDGENPVVRESSEVAGYVSDLALAGDVAVAALGQAGVQLIDLGE